MNTSVAVIVGAAVIGGSLLLAGERLADRMAQDARCAGYLASPQGSAVVSAFSQLEMERGERLAEPPNYSMEYKRMVEENREMAPDARRLLQRLKLVGCRLSPIT